MAPWAKRIQKSIPQSGSQSSTIESNDYSAGMNDYISNDKFPVRDGGANFWRLAQDARIITLGEYDTRKGFDLHSLPVGETLDRSQVSITGAADRSFSETSWIADTFTPVTSGKLTRLDVNLKNSSTATGTVAVELWSNDGGSPGVVLAKSTIASSTITSSYAYYTVRFSTAPTVTASTVYWLVCRVQASGTGSYSWSSTTAATTAKTTMNSGISWATTTYAMNFRQYYATNEAPKGLFRGYKSDGTKVTLMPHGTSLYSVNEVTGALTAIKTGLSASATKFDYDFVLVNDIVYYCNGYDGLRKWDFTTESQVNATNYTRLTIHKGLLFGVRKDDPQRVDFSNFGDYETFTSTDALTVPAPKTGDPVTALVSLNGYLLIPTMDSKYILSGEDNATFSLDEAPDQNGTYSHWTITQDDTYVYYLSSTGVYRSNGSEAQLLSENIYESVRRIEGKEHACLNVNRGRLYLWYRSAGSSFNDRCYVWNLAYGSGSSDTIESHDTDATVAFAMTAFRDDDDMLVASSLVGQTMWQELETNDYNNLGGDINYLLQSHYMTGGSPAVLKEYRHWIPRFGAQSDSYNIDCQYAYDQRDNWQTYVSPNVQGAGTLWGSGALWGSFTWGSTAEVQQNLYIPGEYRRTAIRYKHFAARQPQKFLGHTLRFQTRRLR